MPDLWKSTEKGWLRREAFCSKRTGWMVQISVPHSRSLSRMSLGCALPTVHWNHLANRKPRKRAAQKLVARGNPLVA